MPQTTDAIKNLQRYLYHLAIFDELMPIVPIDGVYDRATREAIEAFQMKNRLPITGVVDPVTWAAIYAAYLDSRAQNIAPNPISPFPTYPPAYAIAAGEESELVALLHHMLRTISRDYDTLGDIPDGMHFTPRTTHAVRELQRSHDLPQTGEVDRLTWNALAAAYDRTLADGQ